MDSNETSLRAYGLRAGETIYSFRDSQSLLSSRSPLPTSLSRSKLEIMTRSVPMYRAKGIRAICEMEMRKTFTIVHIGSVVAFSATSPETGDECDNNVIACNLINEYN